MALENKDKNTNLKFGQMTQYNNNIKWQKFSN